MFEHHAWMSSQFSTFAELFDEAIRQGLPAVQTQHPGYYFQLAANHASLRQSACKELCQVRIVFLTNMLQFLFMCYIVRILILDI